MITCHSVNNTSTQQLSAAEMNHCSGGVHQICYDNASPSLLNLLLIPAVKQLGQQAKWMLWLTADNKLDRSWLENSGISLNKSIQVPMLNNEQKMDSMTQALKSGNYSVITVWLDSTLTTEQQNTLDYFAKETDTVVFILYKNSTHHQSTGHISRQKIPSFAFL